MPTASPYCLKCFQQELGRLDVPFVPVPCELLTLAELNAIPQDSVDQPMTCYWCKAKSFEMIYYC